MAPNKKDDITPDFLEEIFRPEYKKELLEELSVYPIKQKELETELKATPDATRQLALLRRLHEDDGANGLLDKKIKELANSNDFIGKIEKFILLVNNELTSHKGIKFIRPQHFTTKIALEGRIKEVQHLFVKHYILANNIQYDPSLERDVNNLLQQIRPSLERVEKAKNETDKLKETLKETKKELEDKKEEAARLVTQQNIKSTTITLGSASSHHTARPPLPFLGGLNNSSTPSGSPTAKPPLPFLGSLNNGSTPSASPTAKPPLPFLGGLNKTTSTGVSHTKKSTPQPTTNLSKQDKDPATQIEEITFMYNMDREFKTKINDELLNKHAKYKASEDELQKLLHNEENLIKAYEIYSTITDEQEKKVIDTYKKDETFRTYVNKKFLNKQDGDKADYTEKLKELFQKGPRSFLDIYIASQAAAKRISSEKGEIIKHYENKSEFRAQVNHIFLNKSSDDTTLYLTEINDFLQDDTNLYKLNKEYDKYAAKVSEDLVKKSELAAEKEDIKSLYIIFVQFMNANVTILEKKPAQDDIDRVFSLLISDAKHYITAIDPIVAEIEKNNQTLQEEIDKTRAEIKNVERSIFFIKNPNPSDASAFDDIYKDKRKAEDKAREAADKLVEAQRQLAEAQRMMEDAKRQMAEVQRQSAHQAQEKIDKLMLKEIEALKEQNDRLQAQIKDHNDKNSHLKQEIEKLQKQAQDNPELNNELQALKQKLKEEEDKLKKLQSAGSKLANPETVEEIDELRRQLAEQQKRFDELAGESEDTRIDLSRITAQQHAKQAKITAAALECSELIQALNAASLALSMSTILNFPPTSDLNTARQNRDTKKREIAQNIESVNQSINKLSTYLSNKKDIIPSDIANDAQKLILHAQKNISGGQIISQQLEAEMSRLIRKR